MNEWFLFALRYLRGQPSKKLVLRLVKMTAMTGKGKIPTERLKNHTRSKQQPVWTVVKVRELIDAL